MHEIVTPLFKEGDEVFVGDGAAMHRGVLMKDVFPTGGHRDCIWLRQDDGANRHRVLVVMRPVCISKVILRDDHRWP